MAKILVIDDDEGIREVTKLMLEVDGYIVQTAPRGSVALNLHNDYPDAILLDVFLSGEDGRDIARKLKSKNDTQKIPIIMISANPDAYRTTLEAGADAFLPKPFDMDELLQTVKKYVH